MALNDALSETFRKTSLGHHAVQRLSRQSSQKRCPRGHQFFKVYTGLHAHGFKHENQVFSHHIA